ncbi:hypothetical protein H0X48_04760 [Candidatus Dependentiae bacterium]|nr:hypothetical protein [Candidatus Dependentiae bacterium]
MKKLVLAVLLLSSSIELYMRADCLLSAIDSNNIEQVKLLLDTYEYLDSDYKNLLLNSAKEASFAARKNITFSRSPEDIFCTTVGTLMLGATLSFTIPEVQKSIPGFKFDDAMKGQTIVTSLVSILCIYWGINLKSARANLKAAREIKELIEKKLVLEPN